MNLRTKFFDSGTFRDFSARHAAILVLTCLAIFPLFADLGGDYLWSDEGDTAVLALSILKHGVPKAWDGVTFTDADFGARVNDDLVMVSHPWLQYYVTAGSYLVFGETQFAARFPFALAGLLTIPLLYLLVLRLSTDRRAALSACILLTISVQFLLYSRQCRNYALNMFLACLLIWQFFHLTSWRGCIKFAVTAILLFHTNPSGLAPLSALGLLSLVYKPFRQYRRWFWSAVPGIAALVVPWFFFATSGYAENTSMLYEWTQLPARLTQFLIECASVTPVVGVVVLFIWIWVRQYREVSKTGTDGRFSFALGRKVSFSIFSAGERDFLVVAGLVIISYAGLLSLTQSRNNMFNFGLRYATAIIPLTLGMIGILVSKVSGDKLKLWFIIMMVLGVTKLGRISPWTFVDQERTWFDSSLFSGMHVPKGWANKVFRTGLVSFARELWHDNRGTVAHICTFLKDHASPGDILITNYGWEPVYFHTRLPQGLKIMPHYPIYPVARKHQLPEYVFSVEGARWVIWRLAWDGYRDYKGSEMLTMFENAGATLIQETSFPETLWENRPELHFHRFPGKEYKYPWFTQCKDAKVFIFRVEWPEKKR